MLSAAANALLSPPQELHPFLQYMALLREPLTAMLLFASALSIASQAAAEGDDYTPVYLGSVLLAVTLANTTVDFVQSRKSAAMVKSLSALAPAKATVLRDGVTVEILGSEIVRGDLTIVKSGDKVTCDVNQA